MPEERLYAIGGAAVASEIPLPGERPLDTPGARPAWRVRLAPGRSCSIARWHRHWTDARGRLWLSFGELDGAHVLRFRRLTSFRIEPESAVITCEGSTRVPPAARRHLLLNQVLPLALGIDRTVLHASAVVTPRGVVAFAGEGGAGKSTLAAALARRGHPLLADDAVAVESGVEGWVAHPGSRSLRLWADSAAALAVSSRGARPAVRDTRKQSIRAGPRLAWASAPAPLAAICLLDAASQGGAAAPRDNAVALQPLRPLEALIRLTKFAFQLDVHSPAHVGRAMERLAALVESVPTYAFRFPRRFAGLTRVLDEVEAQWGGRGRQP